MDESIGSSEKKTHRDAETKRKLINRLARIEGQIRGLRGMIENDAYCTDILTQSSAASSALNAFNRELIDSHLRGCVTRAIREDENADAVLDDLLATLQKLMK